jgi:hypothetical protein
MIGSVASAGIGAAASMSAANKQAKAAASARRSMLPYSLPGQGAMATLAQLYGIDPATGEVTGQPMSEASLAAFRRSPDYEFARQEGLRGVEFSNAARGMLRSGNNLRGLTEYASGLATQNFNNYRSSLAQLAQIGAGAATGTAQATMAQGAANASGLVGAANAVTGSLGNLGNYFMLQSLMGNRSAYGGGSMPGTLAGFGASSGGFGAGWPTGMPTGSPMW